MSKIKAVLFDFDGTLVDTNPAVINSWQYMASKVLGDVRFPLDYLTATFGKPLVDCMAQTIIDYDIKGYTPTELCKIYREYQRFNQDKMGDPFPGIKDLVYALKEKGYKLGIVTSRKNQDTRNQLVRTDIDIFDAVVGMDDTQIHKPEPEPCLICCQKLGVDPSEAIMIGDSRYDIACGNNAGAATVFVTWSACEKAENLEGMFKPDHVVDTAEEIEKIVLG